LLEMSETFYFFFGEESFFPVLVSVTEGQAIGTEVKPELTAFLGGESWWCFGLF